jgi:3-methylcrotonyl-CoA carboxylase alpha subunit
VLAGLQQTVVLGLVHNAGFLQQMLQWPETVASTFHTRLIDERLAASPAAATAAPPWQHLGAVALAWLEGQRRSASGLGLWGRWAPFTGWRSGGQGAGVAGLPTLLLRAGGDEWALRFGPLQADGSVPMAIGEQLVRLHLTPGSSPRRLLHGEGGSWAVTVIGAPAQDAERWQVASALGEHELLALPWLGGLSIAPAKSGQLTAPMMGKVMAIHAAPGQHCAEGQSVIVLESMKMELHVSAPFDATVQSLHCQLGEMVERGAVLAELAPAAAPGEL